VRNLRVHNHFCNNFLIGNKKALFQTMSEYYSRRGERVFDHLPLTFHIKNGLEDDEYLKFLQHYYTIARENKVGQSSVHRHNAWIVKPGENTNRGNGIIVCLQLSELKAILRRKEKHGDGTYKTYILQKYI
jgi:tubulin---tyrosine ligase